MFRSRTLLVLALELLPLGLAPAACGRIDSGEPAGPDGGDHRDDDNGNHDDAGDSGNGDDPDTAAPAVVSVSPENGAAGLMEDTAIAITFSEPMDQASVEAAFGSDDLPPVTFDWSDQGDAVTITPDEPLLLAEGSDPKAVKPIRYAFVLADTAADPSGNRLAAPLAVAFTTRRRIAISLERNATLTRMVRSDGTVYFEAMYVSAGDLESNQQYKTFVTFALPLLPDGAEVENATLAASQSSVDSSPYSLGSLRAQHTASATLGLTAFNAIPLATAGVLSTSAALGSKNLDVTAAVVDDLENWEQRGKRTQYRLEFPTPTDNDETQDVARFATSIFSLVITYLVD